MTTDYSFLRLLQVVDSAFPVGTYSFSHGLEWLYAHGTIQGEDDLSAVIDTYIRQVGGGQALPAAHAARYARTEAAVQAIDRRLHLSIPARSEREASVAMGERLATSAADAFAGPRTISILGAIRKGRTPGHYPVVFARVALDEAISGHMALSALGSGMAASLTQAAVRLGAIGQSAANRLLAGAAPAITETVDSVMARGSSRWFGAIAPGLEVAAFRQPNLTFRMFAS